MDTTYNFRNKDPIIDVVRTLVELRASMEGVSFWKVLKEIERETNYGITASGMRNWFDGPTRFPQYCKIARVIIVMRRYARRPVEIGDTSVAVTKHKFVSKKKGRPTLRLVA